MTFCMYTLPIIANCTIHSGLQSTFAPASTISMGRSGTGISVASAGRTMPLMRPILNIAPAISAPVEPAETNACASLRRTMSMPTQKVEFFLRRSAMTGCSSVEMTSGASTTLRRLRTPESAC